MIAHHEIYPTCGPGGRKEMGQYLENSFETPKKTCALTALLPSKSIDNHVSMSETVNRHGDEIEMEKQKGKKEKEEKTEEKENEKKEASTSETTDTSGAPSDIKDLEATRQAVLHMGMPEALVQMVMDLRHVEPTLSFTNARQLYQLVDDLVCQPDRQTELARKLSQHQQQASRNTSSNVMAGQAPEVLSSSTTTTSRTVDQCRNQPAGMSEGSTHQSAAEALPSLAGSTRQGDAGPKSTDLTKTSTSSSSKEQSSIRERVRRLAEENWQLTQRKRCRTCRKVDLANSGVTFLPCGHFITCEECSEKFDDCPACGKPIMGTVKTFLS